MTAKERLHQLVDELSEEEVDQTLRFARARHDETADERDLGAMTDAAAREAMRQLDEEELAELGETIADAWGHKPGT